MLKLTTLDGSPVWINPSQVISIGMVSDKANGAPMIGVCAMVVPNMPPIFIRASGDEVASKIEAALRGASNSLFAA